MHEMPEQQRRRSAALSTKSSFTEPHLKWILMVAVVVVVPCIVLFTDVLAGRQTSEQASERTSRQTGRQAKSIDFGQVEDCEIV